MDFEDASEAAKQLEDGDFLPQLKFDALKELEQRMSKIKTEECGLLVSKLQNAFDEAGMTELKRCHFYPAKRVWQRLAEPEETAVFEGQWNILQTESESLNIRCFWWTDQKMSRGKRSPSDTGEPLLQRMDDFLLHSGDGY